MITIYNYNIQPFTVIFSWTSYNDVDEEMEVNTSAKENSTPYKYTCVALEDNNHILSCVPSSLQIKICLSSNCKANMDSFVI